MKEKQTKPQAQMAENQQQHQEEHLFSAINFKARSSVETWLLDSGCTHHMTPNSSIFVELNDAYRSSVKVGNGEHVEVKGVGMIAVQTPSGTKYITDVLNVPNIDQKLISGAN